MKKILVLSILGLIGLCAVAQRDYTYSPKYVQHLKVCSVYTDVYNTTIATGDTKSPYLKLQSTEKVNGWLNGKCRTTSTIYSYDLDKDILKIKCAVTRSQLAGIVQKMQEVNSLKTPEAKKSLQEDLTKIIEDPSICTVENYLGDNTNQPK